MGDKTVFQNLKEKFFKDDEDINKSYLRVALLSGLMLVSMDTIAGFFVRTSSAAFLPLLLMDILLVLLFGISLIGASQGKVWLVTVLCTLANVCFFPVMFFLSGGLEGSGGIWIMIGIVSMFLMLSGKRLYVLAVLAFVADIIAYAVSYLRPDWVFPMESRVAALADTCWALIISAFALGMFFKISIGLFEKERMVSKKRAEEAEQSGKARSAFFASMSHEIRTPINTIIGLNEMILRERNLSEEVVENASNIYNASKMLLTVINDILDVSKIESGKMEIVPVQYETGVFFSDLVNLIWVRANNKNLEFKLDIDQNIPSMLYGDEVRLRQVVANILTNAVKYTAKGSVTLSAKSELIGGNMARIRISVEDTGMGIKKENLKDLFSSFQRVDQEQNRNIEGTGLGLSISKQLIELMGGQIVVDSVYKMGSVFTITVDQQIINEKPLGSMDFATKKRRSVVRYQQSFEAPDAKVLVVDDNEMNLMVAKKLLRDTKVQIDTAASGKECLQKTRNKEYHVIFMDHMMPEMDGEETLREVRGQDNGYCRKTPIVALTANAMSGAEQIYQEKGFEGYLAKPINGALFEATLLKFLPDELIEYSADAQEAEDVDSAVKIVSGGRKKKICVTTDCLCDLPQKWLDKYDVKTMYYYVKTKTGRFCDISEVSSDNLLKYLEKEGNTTLSEPASAGEYENFFARALRDAEKVIHISPGAGGSGGYAKASEAAYSFDNVTVVDSGHLTSGMGLMVIKAAQMAQDGQSVKEICDEMDALRGKVSTTFIMDTAESLYRNGRIHKWARNLCHALQLHPVLHMSHGCIKLLGFQSGKTERAYKKYIRQQLRDKKRIDTSLLFLSHAGCSLKELRELQEYVEGIVKFEQVRIQKVSATISANCGAGTVGLMFMRK